MPHTGACHCGQTTITVEEVINEQIVCHCTDCQRTSGSAFSTNILAPIVGTKIEGPVKEYVATAASGNPVTRVFCGSCGSAIAHKSPSFGEGMAVQTGNLPDFATVPIRVELFTKRRWAAIKPVEGATQLEAGL